MLPKGWKIMTLENLALVERGKFSVRPRNDPRYFGGTIPFVQTGDIGSAGTYLTKFSQTLNEEGLKISKLFPKNTILITIAANIGDTAITTFDVACPDSVVAIQPYQEKAHYFWLKLLLETSKANLDSKATQNAQKNINLQVLKPLLLKTPPLPEQIKIAQILSTWDKAIETTKQLLNNSQQQKKALMQQLLTGKKRFSGFEKIWETLTVAQFGKIITGSTPSKIVKENYGDLISWATAEDFKKKYVKNTVRKLSNIGASKVRLVPKGSILVTCIASIGKNAIAAEEMSTNQQINAVIINKNHSNEFFYYLIEFFKRKLVALAGITAVPILNKTNFSQIKFTTPKLKEQQKIASLLAEVDCTIENLNQQLFSFKQEKKALMQQLLTGKRRVKIDNKEAVYA